MKLFVTGISTDVGKTIASAVLIEALQADYYKPLQAGYPTDSQMISKLCPNTKIFPEAYCFKNAISLDRASQLENTRIDLKNISLPHTKISLVVEGAGGLLSPINGEHAILHLIQKWQIPVVLVSRFYLGSINHSLLTLEVLRYHSIEVYGIIYTGEYSPWSVEAIEKRFSLQKKFYLPTLELDPDSIKSQAFALQKAWKLKR